MTRNGGEKEHAILKRMVPYTRLTSSVLLFLYGVGGGELLWMAFILEGKLLSLANVLLALGYGLIVSYTVYFSSISDEELEAHLGMWRARKKRFRGRVLQFIMFAYLIIFWAAYYFFPGALSWVATMVVNVFGAAAFLSLSSIMVVVGVRDVLKVKREQNKKEKRGI